MEQASEPPGQPARGAGDSCHRVKKAERSRQPKTHPGKEGQSADQENGSPDQLRIPFTRNEWPPIKIEAKEAHSCGARLGCLGKLGKMRQSSKLLAEFGDSKSSRRSENEQ